QAVPVTVGADNEGPGVHPGALDLHDDLALWAGTRQLNRVPQPQLLDLRAQVGLKRATANDLTPELAAGAGQECAGLDQVTKALLLDEPADRHYAWRAVIRRYEAVLIEIQAVVDVTDASRRGAIPRAEELAVVIGHRDLARRLAELPAQVFGPDTVMEDVLGVRVERVGHVCEPG